MRYKKEKTLLERIENFTYYSIDGCWYWTGYVNKKGYGVLKENHAVLLAHRVNYRLAKGDFDSSLFICHRCDNPSCINPDHLFVGNSFDNMRDMINKGRMYDRRGENNYNTTFTNDDILTIRSFKGQKMAVQLGKKYNVHPDTIRRIINKEFWKHV